MRPINVEVITKGLADYNGNLTAFAVCGHNAHHKKPYFRLGDRADLRISATLFLGGLAGMTAAETVRAVAGFPASPEPLGCARLMEGYGAKRRLTRAVVKHAAYVAQVFAGAAALKSLGVGFLLSRREMKDCWYYGPLLLAALQIGTVVAQAVDSLPSIDLSPPDDGDDGLNEDG